MSRKIATYITVVTSFLVLSVMPGCRQRGAAPEELEEQNDSIPAMGFWPDSLEAVEKTVSSGETFTGLVIRLGMKPNDAVALSSVVDSVFDVRKMRAGNKVWAYYDVDSTSQGVQKQLRYVEYRKDRATSVIFSTADSLAAWEYSRPVVSEKKFADVEITSNLWNDMRANGVSPLLIVSLSDIYAWTVDFFGLQEGDRFKVMYHQRSCEGEIFAVDTVYYAEFHRGETVIPAIRFDQGNGSGLYWNRKGESLKGAFLKAPLDFSRVSSGFTYRRKHPVTGKVKPHTAVDYAAPSGTPVRSIGDGTVLSAGWGGGGGNTVKIRHNSSYTTAYLHLSRYGKGIKAGARVRQGQVIGYVGTTGVSTGPHLDFRVWKNGTPINPLKMDNVPDEPLRRENLPALDSTYSYYSHIMDSLSAAAPAWKASEDTVSAR